jgi:L-aminopeptidase/D-esterase-like protein
MAGSTDHAHLATPSGKPRARAFGIAFDGEPGPFNAMTDVDINPFFDAVIQSVEEAILNAMVANEDMRGRDGNFVPALPKAWLREKFGAAG